MGVKEVGIHTAATTVRALQTQEAAGDFVGIIPIVQARVQIDLPGQGPARALVAAHGQALTGGIGP